MAWQWFSAVEYRQQLSASQWRSVDVVLCLALLADLYFDTEGWKKLGAIVTILMFLLALRINDYRQRIFLALINIGVGLYSVLTSWQKIGLSPAMADFICYLALAKRFESRNRRDPKFLFLLELALLLLMFMHEQSLFTFLYALFILAMMLRCQMILMEVPTQGLLKRFLWPLVLSLPLAFFLFLLVPRFSPFWSSPQAGIKSGDSITGLGDDMSLGDVANLAKSDEIIFRVRFEEGQQPSGKDLYWRGPVLVHFDGQRWTESQSAWRSRPEKIKTKPEEALHYEWISVKANQKWLTALDVMTDSDVRLSQSSNYTVRMPEGRGQRSRYHLQSQTNAVLKDKNAQKEALKLPPDLKIPKTRAFAAKLWREQKKNPKRFVQAFLKHLNEEEFYYSLEVPPGMGDVEQFLFSETGKIGFCEHYSNALAIAARTVGIPSRVVTGYQGGEYNAFTGDFIVRAESAHAWTELWYDGRWHRIDPTAAVAPHRIQDGRLNGNSLTGEDSRSLFSRLADNLDSASWLRQAIEASGVFWQEWIMNYGRERQQLLKQWQWQGIPWIYSVIAAFLLLLLTLYYAVQKRKRFVGDAVTRAFQKRLKRWEKQGWKPLQGEPVAQFLRRRAESDKAQEALLRQLADVYEQLRYQESASKAEVLRLLRRIKD